MEKKTDMVRKFIKSKQYKQALRIAKNFRLGVSAEQRCVMARAYECMLYRRFYAGIGFDPDAEIKKGIETLGGIYGECEV